MFGEVGRAVENGGIFYSKMRGTSPHSWLRGREGEREREGEGENTGRHMCGAVS